MQPEDDAEVWKRVPGYELYEVSNVGRLRTYVGVGGRGSRLNRPTATPRLMSPTLDKNGYARCSLTNTQGIKPFFVSYLVMLSFVGPRPEGFQVCHNNNNPKDNRLSNLRYDTMQGNMADKLKHGTHQRQEANGRAVLTANQALEILFKWQAGQKQIDLAAEYGVSQQNIHVLTSGQSWKSLYLG